MFFVWTNYDWNKARKDFTWCQPLDPDDYNPPWKNQFCDHSSECHRCFHVGDLIHLRNSNDKVKVKK